MDAVLGVNELGLLFMKVNTFFTALLNLRRKHIFLKYKHVCEYSSN